MKKQIFFPSSIPSSESKSGHISVNQLLVNLCIINQLVNTSKNKGDFGRSIFSLEVLRSDEESYGDVFF